MKKNVSGQKVGCQMVSASDGSAFTGSVTVAVTIDAGTQATGSVGSGACTHEGNGYHTYAPAQAETNGDLLAFTFTATGAIPATVQVYTSFPQTVDNATNISAIKTVTDAIPNGGALTTISGKIDTIDDFLDTEIAAIKTVTDAIPNGGALTTISTKIDTIDDFLDTEIAAIKAKTDNLPSDPADASDVAAAIAAVSAKIDTVDDFLDTEIAAIKAKTDSLTFTVAGVVDANIQRVNDVTVTGTGAPGDEWGP